MNNQVECWNQESDKRESHAEYAAKWNTDAILTLIPIYDISGL